MNKIFCVKIYHHTFIISQCIDYPNKSLNYKIMSPTQDLLPTIFIHTSDKKSSIVYKKLNNQI